MSAIDQLIHDADPNRDMLGGNDSQSEHSLHSINSIMQANRKRESRNNPFDIRGGAIGNTSIEDILKDMPETRALSEYAESTITTNTNIEKTNNTINEKANNEKVNNNKANNVDSNILTEKTITSDFEKISKSEWPDLKPDTFVRYINIKGKTGRGGYIVKNWENKDKNGRSLKLRPIKGRPFVINYNTIKDLYKLKGNNIESVSHTPKDELEYNIEGLSFSRLNKVLKSLVKTVVELKARVEKLEKKQA